jgi:hypothetical protein
VIRDFAGRERLGGAQRPPAGITARAARSGARVVSGAGYDAGGPARGGVALAPCLCVPRRPPQEQSCRIVRGVRYKNAKLDARDREGYSRSNTRRETPPQVSYCAIFNHYMSGATSHGRVCHSVPISTERAQSYIRS